MSKFSAQSEVYSLGFSIMGSDEIRRRSNVQVSNKGLFDGEFPVEKGVYDPHMGTTAMEWRCRTCNNRKTKCPGHAGSIDMRYPVKSPLFRDLILKWLKAVCHTCGELVLDRTITSTRGKRLAILVRNVKRGMTCINCKAIHPMTIKHPAEHSHFMVEIQKEGMLVRKTLFNDKIARILGSISDETVIKMGFPLTSHPKKLVLNTIHVPPNTIRPDIRRSSGRSNSSHITSFIKTIREVSDSHPPTIPEEVDNDLQVSYNNVDTIYHNMVKGSSATGNQLRVVTAANRVPNSIMDNLPKKPGRFRRNLGGKRTLFAVRSVISGDPTLKIDEIGIPKHIAKTLAIPEVVQPYNIKILTMYFRNKRNVYPGCGSIRKKVNGKLYDTEFIDPEYALQIGDTVYRDLIDGDVVAFNRAPSLTWTSVAAHKVVILEKSNALRCNVSVCSLYNGDFDGDNMTVFVACNIQSRNELLRMSMVGNWMISYKNSSPMIGAFQDSLVGASEFTQKGISANKWHAMCLMAGVGKSLSFDKKSYTNRELFSMLLPQINMSGKKPKQYMSQYAAYIDYDPEDIKVEIDRGQLISGVLDKSTLGQTTMGSVFHIINNEYGSARALDTIFDIQQMLASFFYYKGFTTGVNDLVISDDARLKVKQKITAMIIESQRLTEKLDRRDLIPPMGTTQEEFFEYGQLNAMESGDDFIRPILSSIDMKTNGLAKLILSGSKGNINNIFAINAALGNQTINGARPKRNFSWGRTSPYFPRYSTSPDSLGYVDASYILGIPSHVYAFAAGTARQGVISIALTTSVTGEQNRTSVKNFESTVVDNLRKSAKPQNVIQTLCLETGIDPRRTEKVKFPTVMISDVDMENKYHAKLAHVAKPYRNDDVRKILDAEFDQLVEDRNQYRKIALKIEADHVGHVVIDNTHQMPVNIYRLIEDTAYNYRERISDKKTLDPVSAIKKIRKLVENIPYAYFNDVQEKKKADLPYHIVQATTLFKILLRSHLCVRHLNDRKINDDLLDVIIDKVKTVFVRSLMQYGTAIGIISAQSISEPMTQTTLDTKHRAGAGGKSKTNPIVRVIEIVGVRDTKKMKNPSMILAPLEEYEHDESKVREIANSIEMMKMERFLSSTTIFFEEFGNPVHPRFAHEKKIIEAFQKHGAGESVPEDLTKWCIRFELNRTKLVINHMNVEKIVHTLRIKFPDVYLVYTPENAKTIIIRCYIRSSMMKVSSDEAAMKIMHALRECVISGVDGIQATRVVDRVKSYITEDGSIKTKKVWAIATTGSNLAEVVENEHLDASQCQTDSIVEFEEMYGIEAARGKVVAEILKTIDANRSHCTMYADEMSYLGYLTSIQRSGIAKRERGNVCLRMAFGSPVQVLVEAAAQGLVSKITGVSAPLIVGSQPKTGTRYNQVCVNEQFIRENSKSLANVEDEL